MRACVQPWRPRDSDSVLFRALVRTADEVTLEGEEEQRDRDGSQQGRAHLERELRAGSQLAAGKTGQTGDHRLEPRALGHDQEVAELVPRSLERQDRQGDQSVSYTHLRAHETGR